MNRKTKIIFLFSLVCLFILVFTNNVFATDTIEIEVDQETYYIPDVITNSGYTDSCIFTTNSGGSGRVFYVACFNSANSEVVRYDYFDRYSYSTVSIFDIGTTNISSLDNGIWYTLYDVNYDSNISQSQYSPYKSSSVDAFRCLYSTVDIYWATNHNQLSVANYEDVFFSVPVEQEQETILAPVIQNQETQLQGTLQQIIQILPLILVVVVSLVGLHKGLMLLSRLLHKS